MVAAVKWERWPAASEQQLAVAAAMAVWKYWALTLEQLALASRAAKGVRVRQMPVELAEPARAAAWSA